MSEIGDPIKLSKRKNDVYVGDLILINQRVYPPELIGKIGIIVGPEVWLHGPATKYIRALISSIGIRTIHSNSFKVISNWNS